MKKLRRILATLTLGLVLMLGSGSMIQVRADGPQGTQETKSKGPSSSSGSTSQQDLYLLWLIILWLLGLL
jgi:hypothetical protein